MIEYDDIFDAITIERPTEKQIAYLHQCKAPVPETKAEATRAISSIIALKRTFKSAGRRHNYGTDWDDTEIGLMRMDDLGY